MSSTPRAVVTGGGVRLGRAVALRLARAGYALALHYHASQKSAAQTAVECRALGAEVHLVQADLSSRSGPEEMCRSALERLGGADLLVNNAAVFFPTRTLAEAAAAWDVFHDVNLRAPFLCCAGLAEALAERGGSIVNIADIYARYPLKGYLPYCLSKAGIVALTRALALELAPRVRVNAVAPGAVLLPAAAPADLESRSGEAASRDVPMDGEGGAEPSRPISPGLRSALEARLSAPIPMGRLGGAEAVADAVAYLASAEFVTGQVLAVDGGRTVNLAGFDAL